MRRETLSHPLAIAGVVIATAAAVVFITLVIAGLAGMFENPYAGLVIFLAIPAVFVLGLLLIPGGVWLQQRTLARDPNASADWPVIDFRRPRVRKVALLIAALTAVNAVIVLLAGYGGLHAMESPAFCGQVCHTPMTPQFTAWRAGAHGQVACVQCHIGEGAGAFVQAKLAGVRQLVHVATNSFPRPIPPGTEMRPGAQAKTCLGCHPPQRAARDEVFVVREYGDDEAGAETMTVMQMHLAISSSSPRAIHWHADPSVRVEYIATDHERQMIPYVRVTNAQGQTKEYVAADATEGAGMGGERRTMDCIDCHNTVGHPIAATPERAVDRAISGAQVSRHLPYARRESIRLLKATYPDQDAAAHAIDHGLRGFYKSHSGAIDEPALARTIAALQDLYRRNVFPAMQVTWGTYPDNRGHMTSTGCFRCHDDSHKAKDGSTISADCEYCHKQIER